MRTNNYALELMAPGQVNKDITFNETILKIDQFLNMTINNIAKQVPEEIKVGEKIIITEGEKANQICFLSHQSKKNEFLMPPVGMIVFNLTQNSFLQFTGNEWIKIINGSGELPDNFTSIGAEHIVQGNLTYQYLFLNDNCSIEIEKTTLPEITLIIKQNHHKTYELTWTNNILWEHNKPHIISSDANRFDIIKLFSLPETHHFLGKIISQNHHF